MAIQKVTDAYILAQTPGDTYQGDSSDQTYSINPNLVQAGEVITIIDQGGSNYIELPDGLEIASSIVTATEILLTLSNGAQINVRGADNFTFKVGQSLSAGDTDGTDLDFETFAQDILGVTVPAAGSVEGGPITIIDDGTVIPGDDDDDDDVDGDVFLLTDGNDVGWKFTSVPVGDYYGTEDDDLYIADLYRVGGKTTNSLNSGDRLDGNGGDNQLWADIMMEASIFDSAMAIHPKTHNIQETFLNAREIGNMLGDVTIGDIIITNDNYGIIDGYTPMYPPIVNGEPGPVVLRDSIFDEWGNVIIQGNLNLIDIDLDMEISSEVVHVNAREMLDLTYIESYYSDADLVVYGLTTNQSDGGTTKLSDMTVSMDHTSGSTADTDAIYGEEHEYHKYINGALEASSMKVLFEQNYLVPETQTDGSQLFIEMMDMDAALLGRNPLEDHPVRGLNFTMDGEAKVLDWGDIGDDFGNGTYPLLLDTINAAIAEAALVDPDFETLSADFGPNFIATDTDNDPGGSFGGRTIVITNSGEEELAATGLSYTKRLDIDPNKDFHTQVDTLPPSTEELPLEINIELEKVGRGEDGGGMIVGGDNYTKGFDKFNVTVKGDEDMPSSLAYLLTTPHDGLETLDITSEERDDDSYADLTIGNTNTPVYSVIDLNNIDATTFMGNLDINQAFIVSDGAYDYNFGAGDDNLQVSVESFEPESADGVAFDISMGAGDDTVDVELDGDAVDSIGDSLTITTGEGDDTVTLTGTSGVSDATTLALDNVNVDLGADDDTMYLYTEIITKVNAGAGSDFVEVDADNAVGAPNGTTGIWTIGTGTENDPGSWGARVLYEATLTVDFAGFEQRITIPTTKANNFVATQEDINAAIIAAIAANPELSKLLTTEIGVGNENTQILTIESTVQGVNGLTISINQPAITAVAVAVAGDTTIAPSEYAALEAGLLETGAVADSSVIGTVTPEADLIGVFGGIDGNINELGVAVPADLVIDVGEGTIGTDNTNATSRAIIDMGTGAHDLVALDSDVDSIDTVVFSANWGKVSIVNFDGTSIETVGQDEVQTIDVTGVEAGEQTLNGNLTITLGNGEVVEAVINTNDGSQQISNAIVTAINGSTLNGTGGVTATNGGGTVVTITYDSSLGNVADTLVDMLIATDATVAVVNGANFTPEVTAEAEVTNVTFATDGAIGDTIDFDGTQIILADTDGSGTVELDEIAEQVADGTYANFTVTDYDYSAATVQFTAINPGADQSVVSGLLGADMAAGDFTFSGLTTAATVGFAAVGTTVTAGQQGVDAVAAVTEGDDTLTFTAADESGTLSLFVDHDGDASTDKLQIDVALLDTDSAISVGTKAAAALDAALGAAWTITDNGDATVTLAKDVSLGAVEPITWDDGAVDTPIADATTIIQGQIASGVTLNGDILDFTAWLDDQTSVSGSTGSAVDTATIVSFTSAAGDLNLESNEVVIVNDFVQDIGVTPTETWEAMDAADIDAALEGATDAYGNFVNGGSTAVADPANQVGTGISSILMVENDLNDGEYKVFYVETNAAADDGSEFTVEMIGVIDFGSTQTDLTDANFA